MDNNRENDIKKSKVVRVSDVLLQWITLREAIGTEIIFGEPLANTVAQLLENEGVAFSRRDLETVAIA